MNNDKRIIAIDEGEKIELQDRIDTVKFIVKNDEEAAKKI